MPKFLPTKRGVNIFAPTDGSGNPRGPVMGEMQTWTTEVEAYLDTEVMIKQTAQPVLWVSSSGDDDNDGLGSGSTHALATISAAHRKFAREYNLQGFLPRILVPNTDIIVESFSDTTYGQMLGASTYYIEGAVSESVAGQFSWRPSANWCNQHGDGGAQIIKGIKFEADGASDITYIIGHQCMAIDIETGCEFGPAANGTFIYLDRLSSCNILAPYTISGSAAYFALLTGGCQLTHSGSMTCPVTGSPAFSAFFRLAGAGNSVALSPSINWSGAFTTAAMAQWQIIGPNAISLGGNTVPGNPANNQEVTDLVF
jgi:hypothetical protein